MKTPEEIRAYVDKLYEQSDIEVIRILSQYIVEMRRDEAVDK